MEGNQMKMREALNNIGNAAAWVAENCNDQQTAKYMNDIIAMVQSALPAPPRNCDVGTAEEQAERMRLYCNSHGEDESGCFRCDKCPFLTVERCELAWAQMPYDAQEGGAK